MKLIMIEIVAAIFIFLFIGAFSFLLLQKNINAFYKAKQVYQKVISCYEEKNKAEKNDIAIKKLLYQWQKRHPDLYRTISENYTTDRAITSLTAAIQQSGFTIQKNESFDFILSGKYNDMFYLIGAINQLSWPISLLHVAIQGGAQFHILFTLGKVHD